MAENQAFLKACQRVFGHSFRRSKIALRAGLYVRIRAGSARILARTGASGNWFRCKLRDPSCDSDEGSLTADTSTGH